MKPLDETTLPDSRPMIVKLAEKRNEIVAQNIFNPPVTLGIPKKGSLERKKWMAMDACIKNVLSNFKNDLTYMAYPSFVGYSMLSNASQEALIRAGVETVADEMTRKPIELYYDEDKDENSEKLINDLNSDMVKFKVKATLNDAMLKDGFFGGCLVYIDVGDLSDEEKAEPLNLDKRTFKKDSLRGFKVIEPINIAPGEYNTTDPTDENFFKPKWWYVLGKKYDASRFLYIASNDAPDILKPAYNFFGIPQAQMALDYVANFIANRESAQELLNKFSLTCFATNLTQALQQNGSWSDIINRMRAFNKFKTNNGTFVLDKETEQMMQLNTPLSGVKDIVEMSLNVLTAIWHIPKIKYIGEGEGGLNASSQEQMRSYYDYIHSLQEKVFTNPFDKIIKILQLNRGLEPDEKLMFKFPTLWDMDEQERAQLNKTLADRAAVYIANGVISQEEERRRLSLDRNSGYSDIDVDDLPEVQEQPLENAENEEKDEIDREAVDKTTDDMALDEINVQICEIKKSLFGKISCVFDNNFDVNEKRDAFGKWTKEITENEWDAIKKATVVDISDLVKENPTKTEVLNFIREAMKEKENGATETATPEWKIDYQSNKKEKQEIAKSSRFSYLKKHPDERDRRYNYVLASKRIIPNAVYGDESENTKKDKKPRITKYHYFYAKVKIGNTIYLIKIDASQRVGESEEKPQNVHLYDIIEKSREEANP